MHKAADAASKAKVKSFTDQLKQAIKKSSGMEKQLKSNAQNNKRKEEAHAEELLSLKNSLEKQVQQTKEQEQKHAKELKQTK